MEHIVNEEDNKEEDTRSDIVKRIGSVKKCFHSICRRGDGGVNRDSYDKLMEGKSGFVTCKAGVKRCTAVWWKIFLLIGMMLLLAGVVCISCGYIFAPQNDYLQAIENYNDTALLEYQHDMEIVKLVGFILFCVGGLTVAVALMIPSFLYRYFEIEEDICTQAVLRDKKHDSKTETSSLIDSSKRIEAVSSDNPPTKDEAHEGKPNQAFR